MADDNRSVFERLDSIEASQSVTKAQNDEIIGLLKKIGDAQLEQRKEFPQSQPPKIDEKQVIQDFVRSATKEHVWFGSIGDFNKSKMLVNVICIVLIIVTLVSTILMSLSIKFYSTFSFLENIWMVFVCIILAYSINSRKKMLDIELKEHSTYTFIQDEDGTWRDTNKEKKRFKAFRIIAYISAIGNIIVVWCLSNGTLAIMTTIFELLLLGLSIGLYFAYANLACMYGTFILYTGYNVDKTQKITLIFDVIGRKLAPFEEYKEKYKDLL